MSEELDVKAGLETCHKIVEQKGRCKGISCERCPGSARFNNGTRCKNRGWSSAESMEELDPVSVQSAKDYIAKHEGKDMKKKLIAPQSSEVEWVVNDLGELGVRIYGKCYFLYKGTSLVYEGGRSDENKPMMVRTVGKREFGECCHPIANSDLDKWGTVSLDDCDRWEIMNPELQKTKLNTHEGNSMTRYAEDRPELRCSKCARELNDINLRICGSCEADSMEEPTHTPGPWTMTACCGMTTGFEYAVENVCKVYQKSPVELVDLETLPDTEAEANANLITAAPDMFEALVSVIDEIPLDDNQPKTWKKVYAALAKARGEKMIPFEEPEEPKFKLFEIDWTREQFPTYGLNQCVELGTKLNNYRIFGYTDNKCWIVETFDRKSLSGNSSVHMPYCTEPCDVHGNRRYAIGRLEV